MKAHEFLDRWIITFPKDSLGGTLFTKLKQLVNKSATVSNEQAEFVLAYLNDFGGTKPTNAETQNWILATATFIHSCR